METRTQPSPKDSARRAQRRRWQSFQPIALTLAGLFVLLSAWRIARDPDRHSPILKHDPQVSRFIDVEGAKALLYLAGSASEDALLVLGDSRAGTGVSISVLARHGIEPVGLLWNGFAQLDQLLRAARKLPQKRLVVCLSPTAVYVAPMKRQEIIVERERAKPWTERLDFRLDEALDIFRQRTLRTIEPKEWAIEANDEAAIQPDRHRGLYEWLMGPEFEAERELRFEAFVRDLRALRDEGRTIACVRLPTQLATEEIESRTFPSQRFADVCSELDLPFLDLFGRGWETSDGSHLLGRDAEEMTVVLANWLNTLPRMRRDEH